MDKKYSDFLNTGRLVACVAGLEASALDVRDLLQHMPGQPSVGDELQEIATIAGRVAEKLNIAEQVRALRALQETSLQSSRETIEAFAKAVETFRELYPSDGEDGTTT